MEILTAGKIPEEEEQNRGLQYDSKVLINIPKLNSEEYYNINK